MKVGNKVRISNTMTKYDLEKICSPHAPEFSFIDLMEDSRGKTGTIIEIEYSHHTDEPIWYKVNISDYDNEWVWHKDFLSIYNNKALKYFKEVH